MVTRSFMFRPRSRTTIAVISLVIDAIGVTIAALREKSVSPLEASSISTLCEERWLMSGMPASRLVPREKDTFATSVIVSVLRTAAWEAS